MDFALQCHPGSHQGVSMRMSSLLAAMALTACTGEKPHNPTPDGGGVSDSGTDGITPQAFIEQFVTAQCAHAFSCMAQYPTTTGTTFADDWGTSQSDCLTTDDDLAAGLAWDGHLWVAGGAAGPSVLPGPREAAFM